MNSEGIKTFIMLSKLKNFTRTAERMYVAQSTVTNRIAELESETGQKLFVRRQGGVELTEEGQLFLSYALRINELSTILEPHIRTETAKFITNARPLEEFELYLTELKDLGVEELLDYYTAAYEAYLASMA